MKTTSFLHTATLLALIGVFSFCTRAENDFDKNAHERLGTKAVENVTPYFYYYDDTKQYLELDTKYIFLSVSNEKAMNALALDQIKYQPVKADLPIGWQSKTTHKRYWTKLDMGTHLSEELYLKKLLEIKNMGEDLIVAPFFKRQKQDNIGLSNFLYVKLKSLEDFALLEEEAEKEQAVVVYRDDIVPLWCVVSITPKSRYNAMELASHFYELGLFQYAEPDLMVETKFDCATDANFDYQWGLKNTGQNPGTSGGTVGVDIGICDAWPISTGNNVVVAVVDTGIDITHPDLADNIYPLSYDCDNQTSPQQYFMAHGTAVAGIIGALRNNSTAASTAGVAPNCKIMSISFAGGQDVIHYQKKAYGMEWAAQNGADVINCSWHDNPVPTTRVRDAIDYALTNGRTKNGQSLGCVVVFSAGNDGGYAVNAPAKYPNVIGVGAVDSYGLRFVFSNFGDGLDLVAPGKDIRSTYAFEPWATFPGDGTSFAVPHVAGVAALLLSVSPDLRQQDVRYVLETKANRNKLSAYSFSTNKPHGPWNPEVGYGLVDAPAALNALFMNRTINLGFHYHGGPVAACCNNTPLLSGSYNYQVTNYTGQSITQTVSVPNGYRIELEEEPRGDYVLTGENTSNLTVTYYLTSSGSTVNSLILKFSVQ